MKDICSLNSLRCYNGDKKVPSPYDWRDQFNKGVTVGKHAQGWKLNLHGRVTQYEDILMSVTFTPMKHINVTL